MYTKEFEVRWNDIDANRHLANSAYINYMSHTRLSYMLENGFGQSKMVEYNIGPVVFYEHMYYFKEVFPGKPIKVSLQLKGLSENGMYFSFLHNCVVFVQLIFAGPLLSLSNFFAQLLSKSRHVPIFYFERVIYYLRRYFLLIFNEFLWQNISNLCHPTKLITAK